MVGLLLSFLTIPDMLAGKQVVLQVDNTRIAALFGWEDKQVKGDIAASRFILAYFRYWGGGGQN